MYLCGNKIDKMTLKIYKTIILPVIRHIKSRRMRWAGHVARMGEEGKVYKVLVGKPEGKRPAGRPKLRWGGWEQNGS
jgi:hypothetical protein